MPRKGKKPSKKTGRAKGYIAGPGNTKEEFKWT